MRTYKQQIINYGKRHGKSVIAIGSLFVVGCALGVALSFFTDMDKLTEIGETVKGVMAHSGRVDKTALFKAISKEYFLLFFLIWVCSLSTFLVPVSVLTVVFKGMAEGFSSAVIVRSVGADGIIFSAVNTLVRNILFAPIFIVLAVVSIRMALKTRRIRLVKNQKYILRKVMEIGVIILISVLLGGFESYFISIVN